VTKKYKYATAPASVCEYCGKRLRSWFNTMHRKCEIAYFAVLESPEFIATEPEPVHERLVGFPPATFCACCRRLDNSIQPKSVCPCGSPMGPPPVSFRTEK
jgi:hypothetical protein